MPNHVFAGLAIVLLAGAAMADETGDAAIPNPLAESAAWEEIAYDVLGDAKPQDAAGVLELEAPYRANDAATVPVALTQPEGAPPLRRVTVIVDENPAPVVAEIALGEAMLPLDFELRVRVDQYSNVRAVAETAEGDSYMTGRFVKASGGCSAPASRAPDEALAGMGEMRLRQFDVPEGPRREAQIMIRHPNFSGLQRDQLSQLFVPAHFIDRIEVRQGDELLFELTGGISISENPVFRFEYTENGAPAFHVTAHDTEGNVFSQTLPKAPQS